MFDPQLFVVRIWREITGGFRASVRRVDEEETRHFNQPDDVGRFFATVDASDSSAANDADNGHAT